MRKGADTSFFNTNWGNLGIPLASKVYPQQLRKILSLVYLPELNPLPQPPEELGPLPQPFHFQVLVCLENYYHLYWRHFFLVFEV